MNVTNMPVPITATASPAIARMMASLDQCVVGAVRTHPRIQLDHDRDEPGADADPQPHALGSPVRHRP